jgi:hypothetical protein
LDKTLVLTPSGIDIVLGFGGGNWVRTTLADASWLYQAAWYVDPATGDDENDGSIGNPLDTVHEAQLRAFGQGATLQQSTTLTIVSPLPASDKITLDVGLKTGDSFTLDGAVTSIYSGTIDAVTNYDGVNQALELTETGHGSWAAQEYKRIRLTSGPNINKIAWAMKNLDPGVPDTVRSSFFTAAATGSVVEPTATTTFDLEDLPTVAVSTVRVSGGQFRLRNLTIVQGEGFKFEFDEIPQIFGCQFYSTSVIGIILGLSDSEAIFYGCRFHVIFITGSPGSVIQACFGTGGSIIGSIIPLDSTLLFRSTMFQGVPAFLAPTSTIPLGAFEAHIQIEEDTVGGGLGIFDSPVTAMPTIVGGGATDTRIGGVDKNYAALPFFNANNGAMIVEEPT